LRPCVFIHTNEKQLVGALVGRHALRRTSSAPEAFDVRILEARDHPVLRAMEGREYRIDGQRRRWRYDDLQSFTPLRFLPPELMGYAGRALVLDPDVFAVRDVVPLLERDMEGKAILCRTLEGSAERRARLASSVMLLDCARLTHWHCEEQFREMFDGTRDYKKWMWLDLEPRDAIGLLDAEWNDFDHLGPGTRLLHNTRRETQPWKTGLPVDFQTAKDFRLFPPRGWSRLFRGRARYRPHPDPDQERHFFALLRECLDAGVVSEAFLREEMRRDHIRHDALELVSRASPLAA